MTELHDGPNSYSLVLVAAFTRDRYITGDTSASRGDYQANNSAGALWKKASHSLPSMGFSDKADNSGERGEFIVEVSLPGPTHMLPGHPLIQCGAPATRLNGWSLEVAGQST